MYQLLLEEQGAFVQDPQLLDVVLISCEAIDNWQKSGCSSFVCKMDLTKAYDPLTWLFLEYPLSKISFDAKQKCSKIKCVSTACLSILVIEAPTRILGVPGQGEIWHGSNIISNNFSILDTALKVPIWSLLHPLEMHFGDVGATSPPQNWYYAIGVNLKPLFYLLCYFRRPKSLPHRTFKTRSEANYCVQPKISCCLYDVNSWLDFRIQGLKIRTSAGLLRIKMLKSFKNTKQIFYLNFNSLSL